MNTNNADIRNPIVEIRQPYVQVISTEGFLHW